MQHFPVFLRLFSLELEKQANTASLTEDILKGGLRGAVMGAGMGGSTSLLAAPLSMGEHSYSDLARAGAGSSVLGALIGFPIGAIGQVMSRKETNALKEQILKQMESHPTTAKGKELLREVGILTGLPTGATVGYQVGRNAFPQKNKQPLEKKAGIGKYVSKKEALQILRDAAEGAVKGVVVGTPFFTGLDAAGNLVRNRQALSGSDVARLALENAVFSGMVGSVGQVGINGAKRMLLENVADAAQEGLEVAQPKVEKLVKKEFEQGVISGLNAGMAAGGGAALGLGVLRRKKSSQERK